MRETCGGKRSNKAETRPFLHPIPQASEIAKGSDSSVPSIDLKASNNHKFSCVESETEELIRVFNRSRTPFCFSGVQNLGATVANAKVWMASARVVEVKVRGSKARVLMGASISRSNCSCSFGMISRR